MPSKSESINPVPPSLGQPSGVNAKTNGHASNASGI